MEKVITDNAVEKIVLKADDMTVGISCTWWDGPKAIVLNKREAEELHQFLGEWLK